jgi:hypothetical protein
MIALLQTVNAVADDSRPYLPVVGPTQLRFFKVQASASLNLPPLSMDNIASAGDDGSPAKTDRASGSADFASGLSDIPARYFLPTTLWLNRLAGHGDSGSTEPAVVYTASSTPPPQPSQPVQPAPASDLLNVSPDMLAEYFKPGHSLPNKGRGGTDTSVYVPVNFNPATPAAAAPPSTATYNSSP